MWNERQRLIRNNQENAETRKKNQPKKDRDKKNISETVKERNSSENSDKIKKNISETVIRKKY